MRFRDKCRRRQAVSCAWVIVECTLVASRDREVGGPADS